MIAEKAVLSRVLFSDEWSEVLDRRVTNVLFQDLECKKCFDFISEFYMKYGEVPSMELVEEKFENLKLSFAKEPVEYYIDKMVENYVRVEGSRVLLSSAREIVKNPVEGIEKLQSSVSNLTLEAMPTRDDLVEDTTEDRKNRYTRLKEVGGMDGIPTPWEVLDEATMGLHGGDFIAIVSRPSIGKTFLLTLFAENLARQEKKILFVTNEMSNTQIMQRFDAMYFKLPYKELRAGLLPDALEERYFKGLDEMKDSVEMVVTQDVHVVNSISSKIDQYKPDVVLIDGMYLLSDDNKSWSKYEGISEVSRDIKKLARQKKVPIIATTQFNRAAEEIAINKVTLSNLGFSDSIGQDADVVLGMFRTQDMVMNNEMKIRMLKIREGEPKDFVLNWDLRNMEFQEIEKTDDDVFLPEEIDEGTIMY